MTSKHQSSSTQFIDRFFSNGGEIRNTVVGEEIRLAYHNFIPLKNKTFTFSKCDLGTFVIDFEKIIDTDTEQVNLRFEDCNMDGLLIRSAKISSITMHNCNIENFNV